MPSNHKRNTSKMVEARHELSKQKYNTLKIALEDMIHNEEEISIKRVCEITGVSKSYLYQNADAKRLFQEAKSLSSYPHSTTPTDLDTNPQMKHSDMLIQYEEVKRKLQESYILQYQLLEKENERLRKRIEKAHARIEQLQNRPEITVHTIPVDIAEDSLLSYQLMIEKNGHVFTPFVTNGITEGFTWGKYIFSSDKLIFELKEPISGISLTQQNDNYILTIPETVTENITIEILIKPL